MNNLCKWECLYIDPIPDGFVECSRYKLFLSKDKKTLKPIKCPQCLKEEKELGSTDIYYNEVKG